MVRYMQHLVTRSPPACHCFCLQVWVGMDKEVGARSAVYIRGCIWGMVPSDRLPALCSMTNLARTLASLLPCAAVEDRHPAAHHAAAARWLAAWLHDSE